MQSIQNLTEESISLLKSLICIPSFSREEDKTALKITSFLKESQISYQQKGNNIWCYNKFFDSNKPTILLRSEEHTSELQSREDLVCRLLLEKKKKREM